jgi:hypothetical protein
MPKFLDGLRELLGAPHDLAVYAATGSRPAELYEQAALGKSAMPYDPARPDRAVHALAAEKMARRFGPEVASFAGAAKEGMQGLGQIVKGAPFSGVNGFDQEDIIANERGIGRVRDDRDMAVRSWLSKLF